MKPPTIHATTILTVRKNGRVAMAGDGQVTVGDTVMKANATKLRLHRARMALRTLLAPAFAGGES